MISKKTINAVELCVYLAGQRHAGHVTTADMSPRLQLSVSYLESLLKPLRAERIVGALKGPGGGYMIHGDPAHISIWDVVKVFERTLDEQRLPGDTACAGTEAASAPLDSYESALEDIVKDTLSQRTLADFVEATPDHHARAFVQTLGRFKFKPMAAPLMPKAPNSVFQLSMQLA